MKSYLLSATLIFFFSSQLWAQTDKGNVLIGGSFSIKNTSSLGEGTFYLGLFPDVGYFVIDNLAVGAYLPISTNRAPQYSTTNIGLSPFARYYFYAMERARIFGEAELGIRSWTSSVRGDKESQTGRKAGLGLGLAYFLRSMIALETSLNLQRTSWSESPTETEFGLRVGLQIYLDSLSK
ncbi:MAG: outer membrane beta-barrel protein [Bacteroidota bacterium]